MGKQAAARRLEENEAAASMRGLRTSPRKLNLVAQAIRGKTASSALAELTFSHRRIARDVKKVLQAAIANYGASPPIAKPRVFAGDGARCRCAGWPEVGCSP